MTLTKHDNVLNWASDVDPKAVEQAEKAARLPFVAGHVALMPDAHVGLGATVGSVIPTRGAVIPAAVGVDIGCGMIAAELPFSSDVLPDSLDPLLSHIEQVIPAGVGKGHDEAERAWVDWLNARFDGLARPDLTDKEAAKAPLQFGTLGSGNHFVEVCLDERDRVWVVLHSGSRGVGNMLATRHIEQARGLMKRYFIDLEDRDLAYLVEGTPEFEAYITAMLWAQGYAAANRQAMLDALLVQVRGAVGYDFDPTLVVNCHHNFTQLEHHHGQNVWLTRKGAIKADKGDSGVIPGSMGTRSYIVRGLGNPASYNSCSHGAGRRLSRSQARRELTVESFTESMRGKTWQHGNAEKLLDEHPSSYKDIDRVMEDQRDLVTIEHTLRQVLNYKGL